MVGILSRMKLSSNTDHRATFNIHVRGSNDVWNFTACTELKLPNTGSVLSRVRATGGHWWLEK